MVLIGLRGAGKSSVGPELARLLGVPFVDADDEVERASGRTVAALLSAGELRPAEAMVLARLLAGESCVLATGGGAVLWDAFGDATRRGDWTVIWLDAGSDELARRLAGDGAERPSLTGRPASPPGCANEMDEIGEIAAVRAERDALYRAAAAYRIDTAGKTPGEVSRFVARLLCDDERPTAD